MFNRQDAFGAMNLAGRAAKTSPMAAPLYHMWGMLLLRFEDSDREVEEAFQAERLLDPIWTEAPLKQGDAWAIVDAKRAATLWLDALERQRRIVRAKPGSSDDEIVYYYRLLIERAKGRKDLLADLFLADSPAYTMAWLEGVPAEAAKERFAQGLPEDLLRKFGATERQRFLLLWQAKGDPDDLARFIGGHSDWKDAIWPVHLKQLLDAQHHEQAVREAVDHYGISLALPSPVSATNAVDSSGNDQDTVSTFNQFWRAGNTVSARRTLAEAAEIASAEPSAPEYWRLRLALAAQDQNWPEAWRCLRRCLQLNHPADVLP